MVSKQRFLAVGAVAALVLGVVALLAPLGADRQENKSPPSAVDKLASPVGVVVPEPAPSDRAPGSTRYVVASEADQTVRDALDDGVVTREEYDQAVANTMACLDGKGVHHTDPVFDESRYQYSYTVVNMTGIGGVTPYDECWMRYERDIQAAWVAQRSDGSTENVKSWSRALACAYTFGVEGLRTFDELLVLWESGLKTSRPEMRRCIDYGIGATSP